MKRLNWMKYERLDWIKYERLDWMKYERLDWVEFKRLNKKVMQLIKKLMPGKEEESRKDMLKKSIAYALKG